MLWGVIMLNQDKVIDLTDFFDPSLGLREKLSLTYKLRQRIAYTENVVELVGFLRKLLDNTLEADSATTAALICERIEEVFNGSK